MRDFFEMHSETWLHKKYSEAKKTWNGVFLSEDNLYQKQAEMHAS